MTSKYKSYVRILKALSDETRLEIVDMLLREELCACKILDNFNITQPTLSYHMKVLTECDLINARREGAWMRYSIKKESHEAVNNLLKAFDTIIDN